MSNVSLIDGHIDENTASTKAEILAHVKKVGNEIAKKEQEKRKKKSTNMMQLWNGLRIFILSQKTLLKFQMPV